MGPEIHAFRRCTSNWWQRRRLYRSECLYEATDGDDAKQSRFSGVPGQYGVGNLNADGQGYAMSFTRWKLRMSTSWRSGVLPIAKFGVSINRQSICVCLSRRPICQDVLINTDITLGFNTSLAWDINQYLACDLPAKYCNSYGTAATLRNIGRAFAIGNMRYWGVP